MKTLILIFCIIRISCFAAETYSVGWHNLPGVNVSVQDFMEEHPEVDLIFSYFNSDWSLYDRLNRPRNTTFGELNFLDQDRAYWIHSNPIHSIEIDGDHGNIAISFSASGQSTSTHIEFSYSIDDGISWIKTSNLTGSVNLDLPSDDNQIIWFSDKDILESQTEVRIRIKLDSTDSDNSGFSHKFHIDIPENIGSEPSPMLLNSIPQANDIEVPTSLGRIDMRFSQSLLKASIKEATIAVTKNSQPVSSLVSVSGDKLIIFLPEKLDYYSDYKVQIAGNLSSNRGANLSTDYIWEFKTEKIRPLNLFEVIGSQDWTETAVRKVLHTFAFGGQSSDEQIIKWSQMSPEVAIEEILTLYPNNYLLSPAQDDLAYLHAKSLLSLARHWSSSDSEILPELRHEYDVDNELNATVCTWVTASTKRGLNPFYHKIGLFETNYHMAVNQDKDLSAKELIGYYDRIMSEHSKGTAYQRVLAAAALSPAIARQYKHDENVFEDGQFYGNEDFAREIHQLFFGILGHSDKGHPSFSGQTNLEDFETYADYHEFVSIRHTARALTDMRTHGVEDEIIYGTENHHQNSLEILGQQISGQTAKEKIESLVDFDISHPESLKSLPLIITKTLADDSMDSITEEIVSDAWRAMESKDFLRFVRNYAISKVFHSSNRVKYWNSFDRNLIYHNLSNNSNLISYSNTSLLAKLLSNEGALFFRPLHNVFGGQTGLEASESSKILKEAFNTSSARHGETIESRGSYGTKPWERNWGKYISRQQTNDYQIDKVSEFLWNKFVADGLKNFGTVERAHLYSLLAEGKDFDYLIDSENPDNNYSVEQISNEPELVGMVQTLGQKKLLYLDDYRDNRNSLRWQDNYRIGMALAFIAATPYMFAQEGI